MECFEKLGFTNDFIFTKVMQNEQLCKELLERILDIEIEWIEYPEAQKTIDLTKDAKSIRLDVYARDNRYRTFNVEMQVLNTGNLPQRSRYYQGVMGLNLIEKGADYRELGQSYVIFICLSDIFRQGRHLYYFENTCREDPSICLQDGAIKVFLNPYAELDDVSGELAAFLKYIVDGVPVDDFTEALEEEVQKVRNCEEWRLEYMTLYMRDQENLERGMEQGIRASVEICREMGGTINDALLKLQQKFALSDRRAHEYVQRFWV